LLFVALIIIKKNAQQLKFTIERREERRKRKRERERERERESDISNQKQI
jgi:hypothetical protein